MPAGPCSEIGDVCNNITNTVVGTGGTHYTVQLGWSNCQGACVDSDNARQIHGSAMWMAWKGAGSDNALWATDMPVNAWEDQTRPRCDIASDYGPAIAAMGNRMMMAWKGVNGDPGIYYSIYDGNTWTMQQKVPGVGTSVRPALAFFDFDKKLYMT